MDAQANPDYFGTCAKCSEEVRGVGQACRAMGKLYHDSCFTCFTCKKKLRGKPFYSLSGGVYCEEDFLYSSVKQSAEICDSCGFLIKDLVLQALGRSYHPACFCCVVCKQSLEGQPFSIDTQKRIYCVGDYHRLLAPTCAACGLRILPAEGSEVTVRVVSMDRSYHVDCFK